MEKYDLLVLGAGSGGLAAAKRAASYGKRVGIIEGDLVGGTCVIRGCVPKKIMSYAAYLHESMADAKGYAFSHNFSFNFASFAQKRNAEIQRLNQIHIKLLKEAHVELIKGYGKFVNNHTIEVSGKTYQGEKIIIATGGRPTIPEIHGIENAMTSDDIWSLTELPQTIVIHGGGYIALEFASIFNATGSDVHVVIRRDLVLRGFDQDCRKHLQQEMSKRGITFHINASIERISKSKEVQLDNGTKIQANCVISALGRTPNSDKIGLEQTEIETNKRGNILVENSKLQTKESHIYAIGDIIGRTNLTPVAIKHGRMVSENLFNEQNLDVDDESPSAIFTIPPVGTSGLSQEVAEEKYGKDDIQVYNSKFRPMYYVLAERDEQNLMKLVVQKSTNKVLGAHMVGKDSPEIIQGIAIAVRAGLTKKDFDATVAIHPSSAEEFVLM